MKPRILIADTNNETGKYLSDLLGKMNCEVLGIANSGEGIIEQTRFYNPDLLLVDLLLDGKIDGIAAAEFIKDFSDAPIVYLTASAYEKQINSSVKTHPYGFLSKPIREIELKTTIELALYKNRVDKSIKRLNKLLYTNREIDQLLENVDDQEKLLANTCRILLDTNDYDAAWVCGGIYKCPSKFIIKNNSNYNFENILKPLILLDSSIYADEQFASHLMVKVYNEKENSYLVHQIRNELNDQSFSIVVMRIAWGNKLYGYLTLISRKISELSEEEIRIFENLSATLSNSHYKSEIETKIAYTENRLKERELYYKSLLQNVGEEILVFDKNLTVVDAKGMFRKSQNFSNTEIIGKKLNDLNQYTSFDGKKQNEEISIKEVFESGKEKRFRNIKLQMNGKASYVDVELIPMKDANGDTNYIMETVRDKTTLKTVREELQKSNEFYKQLFENAHDAFTIIDPANGKILELNKQTVELYGFTKVELIGKSIYDFCLEPDKLRSKINTFNKTPIEPFFKSEQINRAGKLIFLEISAWVTNYRHKEAIFLSKRDITLKVTAEKELQILSEIVKQSPSAILLTDINGKIEYANSKYLELTGFSSEDIIGKIPEIIINNFRGIDTSRKISEKLNLGQVWRGEFIKTKRCGEPYWVSSICAPIINEAGNTTHYLTIEQDITEKKELEIDLKLALKKANEINALKTQLLGNMSHEVRTPLNAIIGYSQIIREEVLDEIGTEMSSKIIKSSLRLLNTLNSIIELSDLESDRVKVGLSQLDLRDLLNSIEFNFKEAAKEKKLYFHVNHPKKEISLRSDEKILERVVGNLIENAIKFTELGGVEISADLITNEKQKDFIEIKIEDTGIGIPKNAQKRIFEPFRQSSEGHTRQFEGSGLGLTISKRMINLLKGQISMTSEVGIGSTFRIQLPILPN